MLRNKFENREDLIAYCREHFASAAALDGHVSGICGGRSAALRALSQIEPGGYGYTRNYLDGKVTRLSMYVRHGALTLREVMQAGLAKVAHPFQAAKFVTELAWRDYWQRLYALWGSGIEQDREEYKTGFASADYAESLPADIAEGRTGLECMDSFVRQLRETGYLHNHSRMWFASYLVHFRRVRWLAGATFFLEHLLDGDPASNHLSWQWVASTFAHKPYIFNRENLEKYTRGVYCARCAKKDECPFDATYDQLSERLFQIQ